MWLIEATKGNPTILAGCHRCTRKRRRGASLRTTDGLRVAEYVRKHGDHGN